MLDELLLYDDLDPKSAALNMAVDEAVLETTTSPALRFYRWRGPALSFGYFGVYADVADQRDRREIVRRWTGGGIVPHGDDLTYSIVIPAAHPLFAHSSLEIYSKLHEAIRRALQQNGIDALLANAAAPKLSEDCFANAVRADVISEGRKIAGAAHRRSRAGLLHQGSIQMDNLPGRFKEDFARMVCDRFERRTLSPDVIERAAAIGAAKYGTPEWLTRR
ncbi:MAG: lipoyl(octanoyl) transferase [Verrucomicrobiota bacterium]|jgi:lipoate-protein ligase A